MPPRTSPRPPSARRSDDDVAWGQGPVVLKPVGFDRPQRVGDDRRRKGRRHRPPGRSAAGRRRRRPAGHGKAGREARGPGRGNEGGPPRKGRRRRRRGRRPGAPGAGPPPGQGAPRGPEGAGGLFRAGAQGRTARRPAAEGAKTKAAQAAIAAGPASGLHRVNPFAKLTVCRWRSSAVERLICNQRVGGSIPSASSSRCRSAARRPWVGREGRSDDSRRGGSEAVKRIRL